MAKRIFAAATLAVAFVLASGWFVAQARIGAVRTQYDATRLLAQALVAEARDPRALLGKLQNASLHVAVEDRDAGYVYEWEKNAAIAHPLPPVPAGAPPPPGDQAPPGPRQHPQTPMAQIAGALSGRPRVRIDGATLAVILAPNVDALGTFLFADALATMLLLVAIVGTAIWIAQGIGRAERRRLEETLEERRAAAREFQRFLADAGHELRTPLTIVSGYVEILSKELARFENGARILEGLNAETTRMRALVEKMLLLARLESPVSVPRLVDVGDVAKDVIAQMQMRFPNRDVTLVASKRASIVIDHDDLYEALRNLIENALRYAPDSPVEVRVDPDERAASIDVIDHGEGIPEAERDKVFDRFYRGSAQGNAEGSGLGLSIVARVAARWNGNVRLQSKPGSTMFTLQFPLAEEVPA